MVRSNLPLRVALLAALLAVSLTHVLPVTRNDAAMVTAVPIPKVNDDVDDDDSGVKPSMPPMEPEASAEPTSAPAEAMVSPEPSEFAPEPMMSPESSEFAPEPSVGPEAVDDPMKSDEPEAVMFPQIPSAEDSEGSPVAPSSFEKGMKMGEKIPKMPEVEEPMEHENSMMDESPKMHKSSEMHKPHKMHNCFMQNVNFGTYTADRCCEKRSSCGSSACRHADVCKNPDAAFCSKRVCRKVSIKFSYNKEDEDSDINYLMRNGF